MKCAQKRRRLGRQTRGWFVFRAVIQWIESTSAAQEHTERLSAVLSNLSSAAGHGCVCVCVCVCVCARSSK